MAHETIKKTRTRAANVGRRHTVQASAAEEHAIMEAATTNEKVESLNAVGTITELDAPNATGIVRPKPEEGWRATIGMFTDDAEMLAISQETLKIRNKRRSP